MHRAQPVMPMSDLPWRTLLLPSEHGIWGMLGAAVVVGMMVVPSLPGAALVAAVVLALAGRQALVAGTRLPRLGALPVWLAILTLVLAAILSVVAAWPDPPATLPALVLLASVASLGAGLEWHRRRRRARRGMAESMVGGLTLCVLGGAVVVAGGGSPADALAVTLGLSAYALGAPFHVRHRLRVRAPALTPGTSHPGRAIGVHLALMLALVVLAGIELVPATTPLGFLPALVRTLPVDPRPISPLRLGMQELAIIIVLALCTGLGICWRTP
jgi:hypothetical protein